MINRKSILALIISATFLFSCKNSPNDKAETKNLNKIELDSLYKSVISVHDEVMPKMGEMNTLKNKLGVIADSLMADDLKANDELAIPMQNVAKELGLASEGMMQWMRGFRKPADSIAHHQAVSYLQEEFESITKVKDMSFEAIGEAKGLLQQD